MSNKRNYVFYQILQGVGETRQPHKIYENNTDTTVMINLLSISASVIPLDFFVRNTNLSLSPITFYIYINTDLNIINGESVDASNLIDIFSYNTYNNNKYNRYIILNPHNTLYYKNQFNNQFCGSTMSIIYTVETLHKYSVSNEKILSEPKIISSTTEVTTIKNDSSSFGESCSSFGSSSGEEWIEKHEELIKNACINKGYFKELLKQLKSANLLNLYHTICQRWNDENTFDAIIGDKTIFMFKKDNL
ncbi:hypothetical protein LY90DRAFT_507737 [Neocallimastix californiae]|uniref:Uncharacterized protein n=1 Tax=Neocallimastix californiae TaxID=1754190 RepID=A0A1Y2D4N5_9FUNG|nr:hypothetical protein LY90DRAFT_507737 [Neocallimastix californiae]|eukprot:ORY54177.1 hypothetical protein LY90DRAFT_507737 [Neocallimastix californiae]